MAGQGEVSSFERGRDMTREVKVLLGVFAALVAASGLVLFVFGRSDDTPDRAASETTLTSLPDDTATSTGSPVEGTTPTVPEDGGTTPEDTTPTDSTPSPTPVAGTFGEVADRSLSRIGSSLDQACNRSDLVQDRILREYGAIFVTSDRVQPPPACIFTSEAQVTSFQESVSTQVETLHGVKIRLQTAAMEALLAADAQVGSKGGAITPRGRDSARRDYAMTVDNWNSRARPGLDHWVSAGRLTSSEANRIRGLSPAAQVGEILELERQGMYFSTSFSKTILASVAAPGSSQHVSMLALDVSQNDSPTVRAALAQHGWFQTVSTDEPHFTYLGLAESDLPSVGLKSVSSGGRTYWVPDL